MKITHANFKLNFFNENFKNIVEINREHVFSLKSLTGNTITLSNGKSIDLSDENAKLVSEFIDANTTRELIEFSTYEEAKAAFDKESAAGAIFSQNGKECFYLYSK